jgi:hypothetical protein
MTTTTAPPTRSVPVVELDEFLLCCGEADLESVDFAEPALPFGFADAGEQVGMDLDDAGVLVGCPRGAGNTADSCACEYGWVA